MSKTTAAGFKINEVSADNAHLSAENLALPSRFAERGSLHPVQASIVGASPSLD